MIGNRTVYWTAQLSGWMLYFIIELFYNMSLGLQPVLFKSLFLIVLSGIILTHCYRYIIVRFNWLRFTLRRVIFVVPLASIILGGLLHISQGFLSDLLVPEIQPFTSRSGDYHIQMVINWALLMLIWSVLYFTSHYFANYKKEEIKNLTMLASQNEIELINLKSQLNPHFMFNALNSIRALVDEDPSLAKTAVTQLSAMLRGALQTGKRQLISVDEELGIVTSYLAIEKIRFEERLRIDYDIDDDALNYNIPPLMLQTLVENAVKHGISALTKGGHVIISIKRQQDSLVLKVMNDGYFKADNRSDSTGIGLKNTLRRLGLLYGKDASLEITNEQNMVVTTVIIPKNLTYENIDN